MLDPSKFLDEGSNWAIIDYSNLQRPKGQNVFWAEVQSIEFMTLTFGPMCKVHFSL